MAYRSRGVRAAFVVAFAILVAACSNAGGVASQTPPDATTRPSPSAVAGVPSPASAAPPAAEPSAAEPSAAPSAAATEAPSGAPVLDPERCPATLPPADHETEDGILIAGDDDFVAHAQRALDLLEDRAADPYADVLERVVMLRQVASFSGMCYDTGTYRVGEETAYAPGYPADQQVVWLAGTIVHDGCHRARFAANVEPGGRDGELACLVEQVETLALIEDGTTFRDYVQGLVDTIDDPASQYWNNPDRHW
jgi:hypothetical protein